MMVLGSKHVGAVLMCKFYKFYICAVVGVIIAQDTLTLLNSVYTGQTNCIYRLLHKLFGEEARGNCMYANVAHVVSPVRRTCVKSALRKMAILRHTE